MASTPEPITTGTGFPYPTLLGLVQRYSPSGKEKAAVDWLMERMADLGFGGAFADPAGNAVGVMGDGPRQVILLGHIDTVRGEIPVRVKEDSLYGRGSVDAKGPLAAFVDAVAATGALEGWQFVVIGAVEEEGDSTGARSLVEQYRPDFVIVGEPSHWERITLGYKGSAWAEINVRQAMGHSARQSESACEQAVALWSAIQSWVSSYNTGQDRVFDQLQVSLRGLSSGEDGFEEWACLRVGARLPLAFPPEAWHTRLEELAPGAQVQHSGFAIPAYQADKNTPLVRAFLAGIRSAGGQPGFLLKTGTADLNIVAPAWGCPALAYGPGDSSLDHTPGEHLNIREYAQALEVLKTVLKQLCEE
jgi:[amino group carrier protein]-lysine/ornithine hydrolase